MTEAEARAWIDQPMPTGQQTGPVADIVSASSNFIEIIITHLPEGKERSDILDGIRLATCLSVATYKLKELVCG